MKNLKLLSHQSCEYKAPPEEESHYETYFSLDFDSGSVFVGEGSQIAAIDSKTLKVNWRATLATPDTVVGIHWTLENEAVVVATEGGEVLLIRPPPPFASDDEPSTAHDIEVVGAIESGCRGLAVSPDEELVLLITGNDTFVLMTSDFDSILEETFTQAGFGSGAFVNVGWGKKTTQFHGSEGKGAALEPTLPPKVLLSEWDDRRTRVCWKGDGQHFAISYLESQSDDVFRKIRVFTRDGTLFSTSEDVSGLEQPLAWRPSGNLIASTVRRPNKHEVAFFEPNGLRHGEFTLPFETKEIRVSNLAWNVNSDILSVAVEDSSEDLDGKRRKSIQLWTSNNYHWYLKQTIFLGKTKHSFGMMWDTISPNQLHVVDQTGSYHLLQWSFTTDRSTSQLDDDLAQVAVIDGNTIKVTPFRVMCVPPPMSAYELKTPCFINQLAFSTPNDHQSINSLSALGRPLNSENPKIFIFEPPPIDSTNVPLKEGGFQRRATPLNLKATLDIIPNRCLPGSNEWNSTIFNFVSHLTWISKNVFLFVTHGIRIWKIVLDAAVDTVPAILIASSEDPVTSISHLVSDPTSELVLLQFSNGSFKKFNHQTCAFTDVFELRHVSEEVQMTTLPDTPDAVVSLSSRGSLHVNDVEISASATSFSVHKDFILFTNTKHECIALRRSRRLSDIRRVLTNKTGKSPEETLVSQRYAISRTVERGARIVTVVAMETGLVLQMPRGNVETIHPRALLLTSVQRHLEEEKFRAAVLLMRRHRLNMNLLYDYNPIAFLAKIKTIVDQVNDPQLINIFLTDLEDQDVCVSMYGDFFCDSRVNSVSGSKINMVCSKMEDVCKMTGRPELITSILTALVKKTPPETAKALLEIQQLKRNCEKSADNALKYLACLTDLNDLFNEALGTYDLQLVIMVAEKSQKDPKEYLPFLNQLNKMEENFKDYTIDTHLKRFEKALKHIHLCGSDFFESHTLPLVEEHVLYSEALKLIKRDNPQFKIVSLRFGEFLIRKRRFEEAGVILSRVGEFEIALKAFKQTNNWRQMVCMAAYLKMGPPELAQLAKDAAEDLKSTDRHLEAAILYEQYAGDVEEAIITLIDGHEWDEALRVMHKYGRIDFIETNLKDAIVMSSEEQIVAISALHTQFIRHAERLQIVRKEKLETLTENPDDGLYGEGFKGEKDMDLFSDTTSVSWVSGQSSQTNKSVASSSFTKISGRTKKAQRKQDKKLHSLKEGGAFEHLALVEALHTILMNVENIKPQIERLVKVLLQFFYEDETVKLASALEAIEVDIKTHVNQIWPPSKSSNNDDTIIGAMSGLQLGPNATANSIAQSFSSGSNVNPDRMDFHMLSPHLQHPPSVLMADRVHKSDFRLDIVKNASQAIIHRSAKLESV